jgi:transposase
MGQRIKSCMSHLRGTDRGEVQMLPPCLDDYVATEAAVRFIDAYAESLDFQALGFARSIPKATGRPAYHPADLLKLYLYGYLNRIRSSRRLEAEAARNLEVIWLLRTLRPDFKTIADFRRENRKAFKGVLREFNLLCRKLELFGAELVAIDGSKFKASNGQGRHFNAKQLREVIAHIDQRIDDYLRELDKQDAEQGPPPPPPSPPAGDKNRETMAEKITRLRASREEHATLLAEMQSQGHTEVSLTDADARKMRDAQRGGFFIGYNVQLAVDAKHDLIAAAEVVQSACDRGQLGAIALAAKDELNVSSLEVVADKGYHSADELEACEAASITPYVPAQGSTSGRSSKDGRAVFGKERFSYDAAADEYQCPAGKRLKLRGTCRRKHDKRHMIYANATACRECPLKAQCTAGAYRTILRLPNEAVLERAAARMARRAGISARRREVVEHVFGTLKQWGHGDFLTRGLEKVRGEFSLSALAYNLKRVLKLKTFGELLGALPKVA